jgi:hypothetical protein
MAWGDEQSPHDIAPNTCVDGNISFHKHIITSFFDDVCSIKTRDLDADGDMDVVACSFSHDIAWWENEGDHSFHWEKHVIDDTIEGGAYVAVSDIDGDADWDIAGVSWHENQVYWWENTGGTPLQWTRHTIGNNYGTPHEVCVADIDDDGTQDVVTAGAGANEITIWYNSGGDLLQWHKQTVDNAFHGARSVFPFDADGDGDLDIAGAALDDNMVAWYENTGGNPIQWRKHIISDTFYIAHSVVASDIDNDGDLDVLGAAYTANKISLWLNTGGDPIQWTEQTIDRQFRGALIVDAGDMDNDGDMDILGTAQAANDLAWWENDGNPTPSWQKHFIDDSFRGVWPLNLTDMDNDGDLDVVSGGQFSGTVAWWENTLYYPPFKPSPPQGPDQGRIGRQYTYTTSTNDTNNDPIYYLFDWGDGNDSGWIGPYFSGEVAEASHTWSAAANYSIRVKARDAMGLESEWSDQVPVSMPLMHRTLVERIIKWILRYFDYSLASCFTPSVATNVLP